MAFFMVEDQFYFSNSQPEGMAFRIEDKIVETNEVGRREDQVVVLERLREPMTLQAMTKKC